MVKKKSTANPQVQEQRAIKEQQPPTVEEEKAKQAVEDAAKPDPEAAAKPDDKTSLKSEPAQPNPADVPPDAQPTVAELEEQRGLAEEKVEKKLTHGERIDRLEAALGSGLGLNVRNFTDMNIRIERDAIVAEATMKAADMIRDAIVLASEPLSDSERIDRLEAALKSGTPLGNLL